VLAIMDSIEITLRRTAAASALAARRLAREDASTLTVIGCGDQARAQAEALAQVRAFKRGLAFDLDRAKAAAFAAEMRGKLGFPFELSPSLREAARAGDVIVTCTTAQTPFLGEEDVSPGAFIAAVGADNPGKNEIAPALMAQATVIADVLEQCLVMGDLHHAMKAGAMTPADVAADLGEIVIGAKPGRRRADEIIVFDSTGAAIQDAASAAVVYARAQQAGRGVSIKL
jgi:ornithine cyclodeaminase/alanine dehydrogenase-like protein (mu-crystallin family)